MNYCDFSGRWNYPTSISYGVDQHLNLGKFCAELNILRPLLITDQDLANMGFIQDLVNIVKTAGLPCRMFSEVQGNPLDTNVENAVKAYKSGQHDGIIAVGGGSAIDVAKAVALMCQQSLGLWDLAGGDGDWPSISQADTAVLIAIPTTAGTGSEVGRASVIIDSNSGLKRIVFHPSMMPDLVLSDPTLSKGLPAKLTAATGVDAFIHCFEAYCSPGYHPMADGIALEGMSLIAKALPIATRDGSDLNARGQMLTAASMGATAFQKGLGAIHALAHVVGAKFNSHHGLTNAVLWPYVMVANKPAISAAMPRLGSSLGLVDADFDTLLQWALAFRVELNIPHSLQDIGINNQQAELIGRLACGDPCAGDNPIRFSPQQYEGIFVRACAGDLTDV